jgi:phage terminase small subunit
MAKDLTKKQKGFIKDIIETGNATQAALNNYDIESDDPENVAGAIGSENLTKPKIQEALKPVLEKYQKELDEILDAMSLKDKNSEQYKTLIEAANVIQKQIQLLTGGKTENNGIGDLAETLNTWISNNK